MNIACVYRRRIVPRMNITLLYKRRIVRSMNSTIKYDKKLTFFFPVIHVEVLFLSFPFIHWQQYLLCTLVCPALQADVIQSLFIVHY